MYRKAKTWERELVRTARTGWETCTPGTWGCRCHWPRPTLFCVPLGPSPGLTSRSNSSPSQVMARKWRKNWHYLPVKTITIMCQHPDTVTLRHVSTYLHICHLLNFPRWVRASSTSIILGCALGRTQTQEPQGEEKCPGNHAKIAALSQEFENRTCRMRNIFHAPMRRTTRTTEWRRRKAKVRLWSCTVFFALHVQDNQPARASGSSSRWEEIR